MKAMVQSRDGVVTVSRFRFNEDNKKKTTENLFDASASHLEFSGLADNKKKDVLLIAVNCFEEN